LVLDRFFLRMIPKKLAADVMGGGARLSEKIMRH
jgi:hypothetical protein